ncbi:threonine/serine dehydratase [Aestuariivirga litoralis]|uniref:threonine/serine dehydratase n=1 Tax=Aestuariivirga litoralis TaxID=2650924 RepID=UPI0018C604AF|nr:threonine/serine dehydratase [Aestuariivirga litoralis]MBG1233066.1 threonine/serine dehydratase [Aestuariivirga litoralis]
MSISKDKIAEAYKAIRPHIRRTPITSVKGADFALAVPEIIFKHEYMQVSGSFKARGAFTNMLTRPVPAAGVVAASGGNHGAAVAYAARAAGHKASIFVPEVTSPAKADAIRSYGADLVIGGARYADALAASQAHVAKTGAMPIHAFEQVETMMGQGTVGLELEEDAPEVDTLLVAVGGGGLIGGIAAWFENRVKVVAVEPEGSPTLHMALAAGRPVDAPTDGIASDSLSPKQVGALMFPVAQRYITQSLLVSDDDIRAAQAALWREMRVVAEPGGACAFAALLSGKYQPSPGERVAVLLCGANTTAVSFT